MFPTTDFLSGVPPVCGNLPSLFGSSGVSKGSLESDVELVVPDLSDDSGVLESLSFGSVVLESGLLGLVTLGSVVLEPVLLGSVVLGSGILEAVLLGSVVLGSGILESVLLGSVVLVSGTVGGSGVPGNFPM